MLTSVVSKAPSGTGNNFTARRIGILLLSALPLFCQTKRIDPPSSQNSGMPYLVTGPDGSVYISFIDYLKAGGHALRLARWNGSVWTSAETISQGNNWFANWADFPAIAALPDGSMLAHWLTRSDNGGKFGYGVRVAKKDKNAKLWRQVYSRSLEEKEDYAGFLTFLPNAPAAIYLAPPTDFNHFAGGHHEGHRKTVRYVSFAPDGSVTKDLEIDADACSCCQTAIASTRKGFIAAYRDHLAGEIRDISIVRFSKGAWTQPKLLHSDGWRINGCPTDGPSIAAREDNVGIAWFTRVAEKPKVRLALSRDGGVTFHKTLSIDDGNPLGRAALLALDAKNYLTVWLEKTTEGKAEIRLKQISVDGKTSPSVTVATVSAARSTGFPKLAVFKNQLLVAWRDGQVRTALLAKDQLVAKGSK